MYETTFFMSHSLSTSSPYLNYQQIGQGEHIVLIHGLFGSLENLNMVAKALSASYTVTSIDVRNHGSSFHQEGMDYSVLAQDVINLLNFLNIETCYILGHSMGGKIAIQVACEYQERIKKLIVADIAPVQYPAHHLTIIEGLKAINLNEVKKRSDADKQLAPYVKEIGVRQFLLRNLSQNNMGQFTFKCSLEFISQYYPQIMRANSLENTVTRSGQPFTKSTLFIKGGKSDYILPEHKAAIATLLPNSKAKIIQGAGHWLHAEKTTAFNKIVTDFLSTS